MVASRAHSAGALTADFELLAESLPQIVWVQERDGQLEFVNARGLGYAGIDAAALASRIISLKLLHPQDRRRAWRAWRAALDTQSAFSVEARLRRHDGSYRWHLIQGHPLDSAVPTPRWLGTASDVHDAKQSNERSAFLLALSAELTRIADPHDLVCSAMLRLRERLHAPRATLAEFDYEEGEAILLTQRTADVSRIEICTVSLDAYTRLMVLTPQGGTSVVHDASLDARRAAHVESSQRSHGMRAAVSVPLQRGGTTVALLSIIDSEPRLWSGYEVELVERVADIVWPAFEKARADRELASSEERLRLAQSVARVGAWEWDPTTDDCFLSPECHELFGLAPERACRLEDLLARVAPHDLPAVRTALAECVSAGAREFEYRHQHPEKGWRWIHSKVGTVEHAGRSRILGIHLDVTDRRHAEEALHQINQRKDEFLAMLAHELRNPLAPIRNAAQILRVHAKGNSRLEWARAVIERQSRHLTRLVDDLLDVSRIVRGQIALERTSIELRDVVRNALETARPLVRERRHQLQVSLPAQAVYLEADLTRMSQVLANLLINAAKYTPDGGRIWLEAEQQGESVLVRVRDTGVGIAPALLPQVFDLFTQGTRTLDRAQGGLGIGLTLVRRIVEMHGGTVQARSTAVGGGAEFIVQLPCATRVARVAEADGAGAHSGAGSAHVRVLVVDDNVDAAESIAMLLLAGHEVRAVHGAHDALETAMVFRPDLVLLDIGLPGMDGYEVARRLRSQQAIQSMRLVAVTGYGQQSDRERAHEAGFDQHLVKPVEPEALQSVLESMTPRPEI